MTSIWFCDVTLHLHCTSWPADGGQASGQPLSQLNISVNSTTHVSSQGRCLGNFETCGLALCRLEGPVADCGQSSRPANNPPVNSCQSTWVGGKQGTGCALPCLHPSQEHCVSYSLKPCSTRTDKLQQSSSAIPPGVLCCGAGMRDQTVMWT
jgi:hypothetical protein